MRLALQTSNAALLLSCLLVTGVAVPALALDFGGHVRDGMVVNLDLGGGWTSYTFDLAGQAIDTDAEHGLSGGLGLGWARSDALVIGLRVAYWERQFQQERTPVDASNLHGLLEVNWFPGGEGFWLKGGVGLATVDLEVRDPANPQVLGENGWSTVLGAGWEFRASDTLAAGIGYEWRHFDLGEVNLFGPTSGDTHAVSASVRYYLP
jgi:opacity protein-like surface antigen